MTDELDQLVIQQIKDVTIATFHSARILDAAHVDAIGNELYHLVEKKDRRKLILDFTDVKFLSSAMLGVMLNVHNKIGKIKGQVILCGLRPELYKVFKISKLEKLFPSYADEAKALNEFGITAPS